MSNSYAGMIDANATVENPKSKIFKCRCGAVGNWGDGKYCFLCLKKKFNKKK